MGAKQVDSSRLRKPGEIRELLSRLQESGLSVQAFARREGIAPGTIYGWRERFLKPPKAVQASATGTEAVVGPAFIPVQVRSDAGDVPAVDSPALELVVSSGRTVRIPVGFDEPTLRRLLRVLDGEVSC